jgi:RsiW-degrading membrane proteinase PrsW (M82 family)
MEKTEITIPLHKPKIDEKIFFFACGMIISVPLTLFIYQYTNALLAGLAPFTVTLISAAFFAPFIEEFSKAYPLFYRHGETQRSIFNLAILVGLGFGLVELLTYVLVVGAPLADRLPGLLFHPASTSITAYGITAKRPLPYYMVAVTLHFSNNFLALTNPLPFSGSIFILGITLLVSWQLHDKTKEKIVV